ncbi:MAG TPA: hypothetical protein VKB54_17280 [Solirubrobacteraceae bacterium]|nr:hypothetical protein [Solirubrobacteraceae bacterium]
MPKVLTGHAELVGSTLVEPGQELPKDADKTLVKRLEAEGRLADVKAADLKAAEEED